MRALISRITVSASGRLTEPLKWTLVGGNAILSLLVRRKLSDPVNERPNRLVTLR